MLPEQIPGTLFVLVLALMAWMLDSESSLLLVALGCAAGWLSFSRDFPRVALGAAVAAVALWAAVFLYLAKRVFF